MKTVLIISQYFPPDVTAAAYRVGETVRLLKERGCNVHIVTSTPHKGGLDADQAQGFAADELTRVAVNALDGGGIRKYLAQYLGFAWGALRASLRQGRKTRFDVIWLTSPPLFVVLCSLVLKHALKAPVVLDVRDIWPESAVAIGKVRRGSAMERVGKVLEWVAYRHCNALTCVSQPMKAYITARTTKPVFVVYNGILRNAVAESPSSTVARGAFCYAGNLGHAQGLDGVLRAFARVRESAVDGECKLHLVGTGALEHELRQLASELGLSNSVEFHGALPKVRALETMRRAGVLLIPLVDSLAFSLTIPSKVFDCMAIGRPIVAAIRGEAAAVLRETGGNIVVEPGDEHALSEAMIEAMAQWERLSELADKNRGLVLERYSREAATDVLIEALDVAVSNAR